MTAAHDSITTASRHSVVTASHDSNDATAGWAPGIIALLLGFGVTFWTSRIIASFHEYGGKRHIRYRDLASTVLGEFAEFTPNEMLLLLAEALAKQYIVVVP